MQNQTWGGSSLPFLAVGRVKAAAAWSGGGGPEHCGKDSVTLAYYIDPESVEQQVSAVLRLVSWGRALSV